ncbi:MAG: putative glycosyltransferase [Bacteroidota bacterium]|jgi:glycosyltransferase involved in cell wall biosynthesis
MKVVGFSFIRNAIQYDYPIVEAIASILPLCDEIVVAVGSSDDATLALIQKINVDFDTYKIKIIQTVWDDTLREGGQVLAEETNKAFDAIAVDADWCFYIQGDEVFPEGYAEEVRSKMELYKDDKRVEGLLFNYLHFYGSYDFVGDARQWYRREVRIIRNDKSIRSYRDAQGFRKNGKKLNVKDLDAYIYHYGWVRNPEAQQRKQKTFNKYWHDDTWVQEKIPDVTTFDYSQINALQRFTGAHPRVMQQRIAHLNWQFSFDPTSQNRYTRKERLSRWFEKATGWRVGEYKNYRII